MAKKQEQVDKIVENEPVVINEKDIISEELKENDVIDVDAPEVIIEAKVEEEAKAKAEAEEKAKVEEEAKAKAEAEEKAKVEEEAKAKAEAEEKAKAEEEAKAKAEVEEKAKAEEEAKAKAEVEEKSKKESKANSVRLKVLIAFTDKYTKQDYAVDDEIYVNKDRAKELLADPRRLVEELD